MGMTMTEKILATHSDREEVRPGETVWVTADVLMTHDVCGPGTIGIMQREFGKDAKVWDRERVVVIPDHYIFTQDPHAQRNLDTLREFAGEQDLVHFYDAGTERYKGVCHVAMPEEGHTRPGEILFGTDSHTCTAGAFNLFATGIGNTDAAMVMATGKMWLRVPETMKFELNGEIPSYLMAKDVILHIIGEIGCAGASYRAIEFVGEGVRAMEVEGRMTLCNMVIEAGGKNGIMECDEKVEEFVTARTDRSFAPVRSDLDAKYSSIHVLNLGNLEPTVAKPHSPDNRATVREVEGTALDQAYIGSCTGGKISDMAAAARILKGRSVTIPTFVVPATVGGAEWMKSERIKGQTIEEVFLAAGAQVGPPSCAACLGGPKDTLGRLNGREVCISTTNRNFPGRMGSKDSQVFLASPLTVAASALTGKITDPRDHLQD